jgi:anti-anti-sigma factor
MTEGIDVVKVSGRLDGVTSPALQSEILARIERGGKKIILDLTDLNYLSSAGLRVIVMAIKRLNAVDGRLAVVSGHWQVARILEVSGFHAMLDMHSTRRSAEDSLRLD